MSREKPGLIRRIFSVIGKIFNGIRWLIQVLFLLLVAVMIISLFRDDLRPLPEKAALRIAPSGFLVEQRSYTDPLTLLFMEPDAPRSETLVRDLVTAIEKGAEDKRVTALVLDLNELLGGGISKLEEVGAALSRFKASGKPVIAVGDSFTQEQYYLASYADEIHLNPMGAVLITGYGAYGTYLKSAADKLKINFHVFRVGQYKDAIEPFTRDDMSEASREHNSKWVNALWEVYTDQVEAKRQLPVDAIDDYVNNLNEKLLQLNGDMAALALQSNLVDHLSPRPQMLKRLIEVAGADNGDYRHVDYRHYLRHVERERLILDGDSDNTVGVIVARGTIMDGEQPAGNVGSDTIAGLFRSARENSNIKALVLRIDSPGGSAFASDVIRQELLLTRQAGIPVIASMASVAASGGYWIAADANQIWATPTTITGSIGVFGIIPTFENTLDTLGIHSDGIGTTDLADIYRLDRPMNPEVEQIIQLSVDNIYNRFLGLVAEARNSTPAAIHEIAQGRVWTGEAARELGLVDNLGVLEDAVTAAADLAGIKDYRTEYLAPPLSFQERILRELAGNANAMLGLFRAGPGLPAMLMEEVGALLAPLDALGRMNDPRGIYLQCLECTIR